MKGCLLLQRRFAYIGHYVAKILKEEYGISEFCGYVYLRRSHEWLCQQKDVTYSTLLLDEEVHEKFKTEKLDPDYINFLEREFGLPSLWPYLIVDRVIMSNQLVREYPYDQTHYTHEEMLRLLQVHAKAIIQMLEEEKPDFLFCSVLGGIGSMLAWHIAKKKGIRCIHILPTCIRNRYIISEEPTEFTSVEKRFRTLNPSTSSAFEAAQTFLSEFRKEPIPYFEKTTPVHQPVHRKQQLKFLNPIKGLASLHVFLRGLLQHYTRSGQNDYSTISPWNYVRDLVPRKIRNAIGNNDLYEPFDPKANFAFFPLHYEPEIALLYQAPYYTDQINLIRNIARSLPVQYKLVVKEHPAMVEFRPRSFYKMLKKIPNVSLISPTISSYAITPHAKLILTISGTVGWEAAFFKKPVITFGHQFFNALSFVKHCHDIEGLPSLIKNELDHHVHNENELLSFLTAIFEDSSVFEMHRLWLEEDDEHKKLAGIRPMADLIAKHIGITKIYERIQHI